MSAFNRFEDDPGTGSALSSSGVIAQQAPALPVNTAPGSAFNRFEDDDGSTTSAQSIVNADETAVRQTREELIASARAKEEQQRRRQMVVFTDDEKRILAELAMPVFEPPLNITNSLLSQRTKTHTTQKQRPVVRLL